MVALRDLPQLGDDLDQLAGALEALVPGPELRSLATERDRLARTIRDYLIPRVESPETPLTVVFAGPTGSGKSTLINSLTGVEMSAAGPLRPTTTAPVVLADDLRGGDFNAVAGVDCEVVTGGAPILKSMVIVDTPDIDSTSTDHRAMAETLIDNADVVVFVSSALRYADAVPWQVLRRAGSRGTDVIHVLNRVGSATRGAVVDFKSRLGDAGLGDEVLTVPEHRIAAGAQRVPSVAVQSLRRKLATLARDRVNTADRAFDRVLTTTLRRVGQLEAELSEVADSLASLEAELALDLTGRVAAFDLDGPVADLISLLNDDTSRGPRRWRRSRRRDSPEISEVDKVVATVETEVMRDLRQWLAGLPSEELALRVEPRQVVSVAQPVARLALEGWIDFVRRIADYESGLEADDVVGRARRELISRLEVVYEQVGAQVIDLVETRSGSVDVSRVRSALGAMTSRHIPVDA